MPISVPTSAEVLDELRSALSTALRDADNPVDVEAVGPHTPLLSLPLDSLALMELMTTIEDKFRILIPDERAFAFVTVGEVTEFVGTEVQAKADRAATRLVR